jgi:hypothetical protein
LYRTVQIMYSNIQTIQTVQIHYLYSAVQTIQIHYLYTYTDLYKFVQMRTRLYSKVQKLFVAFMILKTPKNAKNTSYISNISYTNVHY